ncbi:hypothetical protein AMAG_07109 [Allomyces macrogynus ATCC 38327]|uniref:Uncharacterized protein n=1 Tax=Allomyces macrogynus (strain ATCC 38327) TaxID=578462 RepID=A0A0L0SHA9_ALLM3|nr:hypothetical protein AMAG_07109 [Allomyces macrogynus ATCC 38327]|eukprot:KNE61834.1 hypothetical protein AMAG_07109 [Allomyces macrogynus ATCC 38327]
MSTMSTTPAGGLRSGVSAVNRPGLLNAFWMAGTTNGALADFEFDLNFTVRHRIHPLPSASPKSTPAQQAAMSILQIPDPVAKIVHASGHEEKLIVDLFKDLNYSMGGPMLSILRELLQVPQKMCDAIVKTRGIAPLVTGEELVRVLVEKTMGAESMDVDKTTGVKSMDVDKTVGVESMDVDTPSPHSSSTASDGKNKEPLPAPIAENNQLDATAAVVPDDHVMSDVEETFAWSPVMDRTGPSPRPPSTTIKSVTASTVASPVPGPAAPPVTPRRSSSSNVIDLDECEYPSPASSPTTVPTELPQPPKTAPGQTVEPMLPLSLDGDMPINSNHNQNEHDAAWALLSVLGKLGHQEATGSGAESAQDSCAASPTTTLPAAVPPTAVSSPRPTLANSVPGTSSTRSTMSRTTHGRAKSPTSHAPLVSMDSAVSLGNDDFTPLGSAVCSAAPSPLKITNEQFSPVNLAASSHRHGKSSEQGEAEPMDWSSPADATADVRLSTPELTELLFPEPASLESTAVPSKDLPTKVARDPRLARLAPTPASAPGNIIAPATRPVHPKSDPNPETPATRGGTVWVRPASSVEVRIDRRPRVFVPNTVARAAPAVSKPAAALVPSRSRVQSPPLVEETTWVESPTSAPTPLSKASAAKTPTPLRSLTKPPRNKGFAALPAWTEMGFLPKSPTLAQHDREPGEATAQTRPIPTTASNQVRATRPVSPTNLIAAPLSPVRLVPTSTPPSPSKPAAGAAPNHPVDVLTNAASNGARTRVRRSIGAADAPARPPRVISIVELDRPQDLTVPNDRHGPATPNERQDPVVPAHERWDAIALHDRRDTIAPHDRRDSAGPYPNTCIHDDPQARSLDRGWSGRSRPRSPKRTMGRDRDYAVGIRECARNTDRYVPEHRNQSRTRSRSTRRDDRPARNGPRPLANDRRVSGASLGTTAPPPPPPPLSFGSSAIMQGVRASMATSPPAKPPVGPSTPHGFGPGTVPASLMVPSRPQDPRRAAGAAPMHGRDA